ncbi:hypothetical protein FAM09_29930 [Niastella caeni]|uniref:Lipocalin-like domain-containing protein n=1 Tax=Niastella caeni TaxID=2569763 RepID=A0A4S8H8Q9_9BACT|nr:hypothetical protein [Niastella caeni]THU30379.1 hypothetical protein FAM09_29930 [Niastella caeni]
MKRCTIVSMMALFVLAFSCKKDATSSTPEKLLGKMTLVSANWNEHYNGADHKDSSTLNGGGLHIEFKGDGRVISSSPLSTDTLHYKMLDARTVMIDNDTLIINSFTGTDLLVYFKKVKNADGDYYEEWDHFKK